MKAGRLNEIYETYKNDAIFACIYIREAHPEDSVGGYKSQGNVDEGIVFDQPDTLEERAEIAEVCVLRLNLAMPMYLDGMADEAEKKYVGWPDRLFVIAAGGRIAYTGAMGPQGFDPDEWEQALRQTLGLDLAAE